MHINKCVNCQNDFTVKESVQRKYCSINCSLIASRKHRQHALCGLCKKEISLSPKRVRNAKHGIFFCSRICKDKAQRLGGIKEIMPPHYGTGKKYRDDAIRAGWEWKCARCGYCEFDCSIEVHHKDKNRDNNDLDNLVLLCANCHRALHYKKLL